MTMWMTSSIERVLEFARMHTPARAVISIEDFNGLIRWHYPPGPGIEVSLL